MKKRYSGWVLLILTLILTACGNGVSEKDAEEALRAAFEGDIEQSNTYFCTTEQISESMEDVLPASVVFKEATCERYGGDQMRCTTTFDDGKQEHHLTMVFKIEDDLLCDAQVR